MRAPALVVIGGWGMPVEVLKPLWQAWPGPVHVFGLDQGLVQSCSSADAFVTHVLKRVPSGSHWLGWSLGGQLAVHAALRGSVARVMTLCSSPSFLVRPHWPLGLPLGDFEAFSASLDSDPVMLWRRFLVLMLQGDAAAADGRRALAPLMKIGPQATDTVLRRTLQWLGALDDVASWRYLEVPRVHLFGERDTLVKPPAELVLPPSAQYLVQPGMAHVPFAPYWTALIEALGLRGPWRQNPAAGHD